jgi:hypothetical protein
MKTVNPAFTLSCNVYAKQRICCQLRQLVRRIIGSNTSHRNIGQPEVLYYYDFNFICKILPCMVIFDLDLSYDIVTKLAQIIYKVGFQS